MRIGATACISSPFSTMVSRRTIPWRSPFCPQKMKLPRSSTSWLWLRHEVEYPSKTWFLVCGHANQCRQVGGG